MRTGDFTIEWFQKITQNNSHPRVFSIGTYSSASIAVSIEGTAFYYWNTSGANLGVDVSSCFSNWTHVAICRSGATTRIFLNGAQLSVDITDTYDYNDSLNDLAIGNESSPPTVGSAYTGYLTNFHWVKGTALYPTAASFPVPSIPLTPVANTKLLMLAAASGSLLTDSSASPKTVTNYGVTWANA